MQQSKKQPRATHVQAVEAATGTHKGEPFVLTPGEIVAADHPLVREYPHFFGPLQQSRARPVVEQATQGPGERRGAQG